MLRLCRERAQSLSLDAYVPRLRLWATATDPATHCERLIRVSLSFFALVLPILVGWLKGPLLACEQYPSYNPLSSNPRCDAVSGIVTSWEQAMLYDVSDRQGGRCVAAKQHQKHTREIE